MMSRFSLSLVAVLLLSTTFCRAAGAEAPAATDTNRAGAAAAASRWVWFPMGHPGCGSEHRSREGSSANIKNAAWNTNVLRPIPPEGPARCGYRLYVDVVHVQPAEWTGPYAVDGVPLGSRLSPFSDLYEYYECTPSEQYSGFVWCNQKKRMRGRGGEFLASSTIMLSSEGMVRYVNRAIAPFYWTTADLNRELARLSLRFGHRPRRLSLSPRPLVSQAVIAVWGDLLLEPLDPPSMAQLAATGHLKRGILVDFLGNFSRSARIGLPVYRFSTGTGAVFVGSFERGGRGYYRLFAIDASALPYPGAIWETEPEENHLTD